MKQITLQNILESLQLMRHEVNIPEEMAVRARKSVQRMVGLKTTGGGFSKNAPPPLVVEDPVTVDPTAGVPA
jgi:hypothetical protein